MCNVCLVISFSGMQKQQDERVKNADSFRFHDETNELLENCS